MEPAAFLDVDLLGAWLLVRFFTAAFPLLFLAVFVPAVDFLAPIFLFSGPKCPRYRSNTSTETLSCDAAFAAFAARAALRAETRETEPTRRSAWGVVMSPAVRVICESYTSNLPIVPATVHARARHHHALRHPSSTSRVTAFRTGPPQPLGRPTPEYDPRWILNCAYG